MTDKIKIKKIETIENLKELMDVFRVAFEEEYDTTDEYLNKMLANNACFVLGSEIDNKIIGGLVAFEINPIHGTKEFYIYDIAVHPDFQKKGIGRLLIEELKKEAKSRGVGTLIVEAEAEDTGAVEFYRALGGEEVKVNHFNFDV